MGDYGAENSQDCWHAGTELESAVVVVAHYCYLATSEPSAIDHPTCWSRTSSLASGARYSSW